MTTTGIIIGCITAAAVAYSTLALIIIRTARRCPGCKSVRIMPMPGDTMYCKSCGNVFGNDQVNLAQRRQMVFVDASDRDNAA